MPVLQKHTPKIKQLYLPSTSHLPQEQQAWVKLDTDAISTGDMLTIEDGEDDTSTFKLAKMLLTRIKEWNFTEDDGTPVELNFDNLCRLDVADFGYIAGQLQVDEQTKLSTAEKKS